MGREIRFTDLYWTLISLHHSRTSPRLRPNSHDSIPLSLRFRQSSCPSADQNACLTLPIGSPFLYLDPANPSGVRRDSIDRRSFEISSCIPGYDQHPLGAVNSRGKQQGVAEARRATEYSSVNRRIVSPLDDLSLASFRVKRIDIGHHTPVSVSKTKDPVSAYRSAPLN